MCAVRKRIRMWVLGAVLIVLAVFSPSLFTAFDKPTTIMTPVTPDPAQNKSSYNTSGPYSWLSRDQFQLAGQSKNWKASYTTDSHRLISFTTLGTHETGSGQGELIYTGPNPDSLGTVQYSMTFPGGSGSLHNEKQINGNHSIALSDHNYEMFSKSDQIEIRVTWQHQTEHFSLSVSKHQSWLTTTHLPGKVVHSLSAFQTLVAQAKSAETTADVSGQGFASSERELQGSAYEQFLIQHHDWNQWAQYLCDNGELVYLPDPQNNPLPQGLIMNRAPAESFSYLTHDTTFTGAYDWTAAPSFPTGKNGPLPVGGDDLIGFAFSNISSANALLSQWAYPGSDNNNQDTGGSMQFQSQFEVFRQGQDLSFATSTCPSCPPGSGYSWSNGIMEAMFGPTWSDHGQIVMAYAHTWGISKIRGVQPLTDGSFGFNVMFANGINHWTASSPIGSY